MLIMYVEKLTFTPVACPTTYNDVHFMNRVILMKNICRTESGLSDQQLNVRLNGTAVSLRVATRNYQQETFLP